MDDSYFAFSPEREILHTVERALYLARTLEDWNLAVKLIKLLSPVKELISQEVKTCSY